MSPDVRRAQHINSLLSWFEGQEELFSKRERQILRVLDEVHTASDREIMGKLNFDDPNKVRPRVTGLVKDGVLVEVGSKVDDITGKTVRIVSIGIDPRKPVRQFEFALATS